MKWRKIGQIFDAEQFGLSYAKSPQAVVFKDFVRVYFSTCEKDGNKLISQISYVDFSKDFREIIKVSDKYVIAKGNLGCFDEHGIFPFSPVRVEDKIYAYLAGWTRRISVSTDSSIGLAISEDEGITFQRLGDGPVLSTSLNEPYLVSDGFVRKFQDTFHMWYIYGTHWIKHGEADGEASRVYKIAHATSENGIDWVKEGRLIIPDALNENECQALPTVIKHHQKYHMFFCYREAIDFRHNRNKGYRIGYAFSSDLKTWIRDDEHVGITVSENVTDWDHQMMCYPNIFACNDKVYMLYNGNEFGKNGFGLAEMEDMQ